MSIYDQHDRAFAQVSAFVILKDGERVATVALKFPRDGAGRLYAYVHWIGTEMVRAQAGGYGYDKRSAAVAGAARKALKLYPLTAGVDPSWDAFWKAAAKDDGCDWPRQLERAGFTVLQAV